MAESVINQMQNYEIFSVLQKDFEIGHKSKSWGRVDIFSNI